MSRYPEERYRLLENEIPLYIPVDMAENLSDGDGAEQPFQRTACLQYMHVGDFVECHHNRGIGDIHGC